MSARRNKSSSREEPVRFPPFGLIVALAIVIAGIWWVFLRDGGEKTGEVSGRGEARFERLVGRWLRPDGGYVLEIRSAAEDGKLEASYLNPQPINVAKAEASVNGGEIKVLVELRDENYPGSIYSLTYDPEADRLDGGYYQAALQETYNVVFERAQ